MSTVKPNISVTRLVEVPQASEPRHHRKAHSKRAYQVRAGYRGRLERKKSTSNQVSLTQTTLPEDNFRSVTYSNITRWISDRSRFPHSPSPPKAFMVLENLLLNVRVYFKNTCEKMLLDENGVLLNSNGTKWGNDLCDNFDSYCFTATKLYEKNSLEESRYALSKACDLVRKILQVQHPRTLACFLEVFLHLIQIGLINVALFLLSFIERMSAVVVDEGHPWGQIYRLLGELDPDSLEQAMTQVWECNINTITSDIEPSGQFCVSSELDRIKRVYGFNKHSIEERLLREVLAKIDSRSNISTPRVLLNLAHNLNRQQRYGEAEQIAQKLTSQFRDNIYGGTYLQMIECEKIVAYSQFGQGDAEGARRTILEAIKSLIFQCGEEHPWVVEFMNVLEDWLRISNRQSDADAFYSDIKKLIRIGEA